MQDAIEYKQFQTESQDGQITVKLDALLSTAYEIASAMQYLHSLDILHGDLTAGNVLLSASSSVSEDPRGFVAKVPLPPSLHPPTCSHSCLTSPTVQHLNTHLKPEELLSCHKREQLGVCG